MALRGGWLGRVTSLIHGGRAGHGERGVGSMGCEPWQLPSCWPQQPHLHSPLRRGAASVWQRGWYPHSATLRKHLHVKVGPQDPNLLLQRRRLPHNLTIRPLCCPAANCWAAPGSSAFALWGLQLSWTGGSRAMEPWENQGGTTSCPSFEGTACKACEQWAGTAARTPEPAPSFLFSGGTLRCTIWRRKL